MSIFNWYPYMNTTGFRSSPEIERLEAENATLHARIAELEKAREVIDTGYVIVSTMHNGSLVCHNVFYLADDAWEFHDPLSDIEYNKAYYGGKGYRAVKVAVVRVEE